MKNIQIRTCIIIFLSTCIMFSCNGPGPKAENTLASVAPDLNSVETKLPDEPGHQVFIMNCIVCHSARMVENQPDFPENTWASIVTKMQKTYGAPVSDSAAKEIVQYLVSIKGIK